MNRRTRTAVAFALSLVAAAAARAADAPLSPQASAFKENEVTYCIGSTLSRGIEYPAAEAQCNCVFDFYARHLTQAEMADVSAMSKLQRARTANKSDPVIIAGANALMRVGPDMMQACEPK